MYGCMEEGYDGYAEDSKESGSEKFLVGELKSIEKSDSQCSCRRCFYCFKPSPVRIITSSSIAERRYYPF